MKYKRFLFQLQVSTPRIKGQEYGLLPTPQASDFVSTVRENDYSLRHLEHNSGWTKKMLPTPNAQDWNSGTKPETYEARKQKHKMKGVALQMSLRQMAMTSGKTFQLNPLFVEEMMGFPKNWTTLPFLNGETNQSKPTETQ